MSGWRGEGEMNVSVMEGVDSTHVHVSVLFYYFCISRIIVYNRYFYRLGHKLIHFGKTQVLKK